MFGLFRGVERFVCDVGNVVGSCGYAVESFANGIDSVLHLDFEGALDDLCDAGDSVADAMVSSVEAACDGYLISNPAGTLMDVCEYFDDD